MNNIKTQVLFKFRIYLYNMSSVVKLYYLNRLRKSIEDHTFPLVYMDYNR